MSITSTKEEPILHDYNFPGSRNCFTTRHWGGKKALLTPLKIHSAEKSLRPERKQGPPEMRVRFEALADEKRTHSLAL